jgi:hypothetical protein
MQQSYARNQKTSDDLRPRWIRKIRHARRVDTYRIQERLFAEHSFGTTALAEIRT